MTAAKKSAYEIEIDKLSKKFQLLDVKVKKTSQPNELVPYTLELSDNPYINVTLKKSRRTVFDKEDWVIVCHYEKRWPYQKKEFRKIKNKKGFDYDWKLIEKGLKAAIAEDAPRIKAQAEKERIEKLNKTKFAGMTGLDIKPSGYAEGYGWMRVGKVLVTPAQAKQFSQWQKQAREQNKSVHKRLSTLE